MSSDISSVRTVFRTKWFEIEEMSRDDCEPYYRFKGQDAVVIFAITRENCVLLVRQHRPARGHETLELPAGAIEPSESPQDAARRELREETGYFADELHYLGCGGLRLDRDSSMLHLFAAFGTHSRSVEGPEEGISTHLETLAEFRDRVAAGRFEQLGALSAVLQTLLRFRHRVSDLLPPEA